MSKIRQLFHQLTAFSRAAYTRYAFSDINAADGLIVDGNRLEKDGNLTKACELYRKAVEAAPGYAKAHLNLGIGLEAVGDVDGAIKCYEAALKIDSENAYANYNFGNLLYLRGELERAETLLVTALKYKPEFPEAQIALSNVYDARGNLNAAAITLEATLKQWPHHAGAWYNYGEVLRKQDRLGEARDAFRRATEAEPGFLPAYRQLGNVLRSECRLVEALEVFGTARKLAPDRFDLESMELHALNLFDEISDEDLSDRHLAFGKRLENTFVPRFFPFKNVRDSERRLRVGYVTSDFYFHPVAWFSLPLLERHDRSAYEVYCYPANSRTDDFTKQMQSRTDVWRDATGMSDSQLADVINQDRIDILVDLTGHAGLLRLGTFAEQPAPVQVSWLGYLNTTGLTRVQYRLCDTYTDPPGLTEHLHSETLIRLPHSLWCYRPFFSPEHATEPPCIRNGFTTFGSFNHAPKISQTIRTLWVDILTRLPDSHLVVVGVPEGYAKDRLLQDFQKGGVAASRLTIVPVVPLDEYLRWINTVDVALDTTPYSGGTTSCDTLWMGVPVLTVPGSRPVSRSTASILTTIGLTEWIASGPEDYVRLAVEFAHKHSMLTELRGSLRQKMRESPLMDEPGFVRDIENAYRYMWRIWCSGTSR